MPKEQHSVYYAVKVGVKPGVYTSWSDCQKQITGFEKPVFRKFLTQAEAEKFVGSKTTTSYAKPYGKTFTNNKSPAVFKRAEAFYAVRSGHRTGIFNTWAECKAQTDGYTFPEYKKFSSMDEAREWMEAGQQQQTKDLTGYTTVYIDGSCKPSRDIGDVKVGGIGIYFGDDDARNVSLPYESEKITNQRTELYAALYCLQNCVADDENVNIITDSTYLIGVATKWKYIWMKNGWKNSKGDPVDNQDIVKPLIDLIARREGDTAFTKVKGHSGDHGNEMADNLANEGAERS